MDVQIEDILGQTSNASSIHPASDFERRAQREAFEMQNQNCLHAGTESRELHVLEELCEAACPSHDLIFRTGRTNTTKKRWMF